MYVIGKIKIKLNKELLFRKTRLHVKSCFQLKDILKSFHPYGNRSRRSFKSLDMVDWRQIGRPNRPWKGWEGTKMYDRKPVQKILLGNNRLYDMRFGVLYLPSIHFQYSVLWIISLSGLYFFTTAFFAT
jgi:hypothetical protein